MDLEEEGAQACTLEEYERAGALEDEELATALKGGAFGGRGGAFGRHGGARLQLGLPIWP